MLDEKLIKKLLNKTRLVKFVWDSCSLPLWCVDYLEDATEKARELVHQIWIQEQIRCPS